ncbi:hypothetical protein GALMADRAFT_912132 [Galerina marginata CBS 339.88]|uniref:DUF676 domain-containing protein n=1 Tax=Galerina marginata (strain CBS 339.88) TaxID=685588 RepID=A0A067SG08_GALM3|nr:hypothetical protein GALMADRAFT_912132 [Galerina marginata CBS 339.88]
MKNENSIFNCAQDLLSDLNGICVEDMQKRPILFIAHSTGGLLVKNVITQSQGGRDLGVVAARLRGVIFLGTPHRWDGLDSKAISSLINRLGSIGQSLPKQPNLEHSKRILRSVTTSFSEFIRVKGDNVILWSFFEEAPMPGIGLVVDKFTAEPNDPRYQMQSLPATHANMPKVVSNEDEGYQRLLIAIKQACIPVPSQVILPESDDKSSENSRSDTPTNIEDTMASSNKQPAKKDILIL